MEKSISNSNKGISVGQKSGEGKIPTEKKARKSLSKSRQKGQVNTQKSVKTKFKQIEMKKIYPNGKKINAGQNGILDKIQANTIMQDSFLSEFRFPSPDENMVLPKTKHKSISSLEPGPIKD